MGICCCLMNLFTTREEEIDKKTSENRFNIGSVNYIYMKYILYIFLCI